MNTSRLIKSSIRRGKVVRLTSLATVVVIASLVVALEGEGPVSTHKNEALDSSANNCAAQLLTPAYFYPGASWQQLLSDPTPGQVVIVNPSSGPGSGPDVAYQAEVQWAVQLGDTVYGYINTFYTGASLTTVESQVNDYATWYHITNIFFDDMSSSSSNFGYYQTLSNAVHQAAPSANVMLNPGTYPAAVYGTLGDQLVVYEGPYGQFASTTPPAWTDAYPPAQFAAMVSAVPSNQLGAMLSAAVANRDHFVYATDDATTSTLYESLPSYWSTEVTSVASECGPGSTPTSVSATPPPSSTGGTSTGEPGLAVGSQSGSGSQGDSSYRAVATDGAVTGSAGTALYGSEAGQPLNAPIVGLASDPQSKGYWLAARDGGVFSFGDAQFAGSMGGVHLNAPIVGMAPDPATGGYWMVASDGGIFSFNAPFFGSMGGQALNAGIVGMTASAGGTATDCCRRTDRYPSSADWEGTACHRVGSRWAPRR